MSKFQHTKTLIKSTKIKISSTTIKTTSKKYKKSLKFPKKIKEGVKEMPFLTCSFKYNKEYDDPINGKGFFETDLSFIDIIKIIDTFKLFKLKQEYYLHSDEDMINLQNGEFDKIKILDIEKLKKSRSQILFYGSYNNKEIILIIPTWSNFVKIFYESKLEASEINYINELIRKYLSHFKLDQMILESERIYFKECKNKIIGLNTVIVFELLSTGEFIFNFETMSVDHNEYNKFLNYRFLTFYDF